MLCSRPPQAGHLKPSGHRDATTTARHCSSLPYCRSNAGSLSPFWNCTALRAISIPPPKALVCSWFVPYPGRLSKVRNQVGFSNGGNSWNAGNIIDVPLDRTAEALGALRASSFSGDKIGLYGVSRGAEHALLLASLMVRDGVAGVPDAIAVHSAPDVVCGAFDAKMWRGSGEPGWRPQEPGEGAWGGGRTRGCTP